MKLKRAKPTLLTVAITLAWLAWLAGGWLWVARWGGFPSGWLGPEAHARLQAVPWRIYTLYCVWLLYVGGGVVLASITGAVLWPRRAGGVRSLGARMAVALLLAGGGAAGLEWSVRAYEAWFRPLDLVTMVPDPDLVWRIAPACTADINEFGLRNGPLAPRPGPDEVRVLCLGDSCTYGVGVKTEAAFPARLEAWLQARTPHRAVHVLNAGVPGYSSLQGLIALRRGLALGPQVVVWCFAHNDVNAGSLTDRAVLAPRGAPGRVAALMYRSHFYRFLRAEVLQWEAASEAPSPRVPAADAVWALREAAVACQAAHARLVVLVLPDRLLDEPEQAWKAQGLGRFVHPALPAGLRPGGGASPSILSDFAAVKRAHRTAVEAEAQAAHLPLVFPLPQFRRRGMAACFLSGDPIHPAAPGAAAIAEALGPVCFRMAGLEARPQSRAGETLEQTRATTPAAPVGDPPPPAAPYALPDRLPRD